MDKSQHDNNQQQALISILSLFQTNLCEIKHKITVLEDTVIDIKKLLSISSSTDQYRINPTASFGNDNSVIDSLPIKNNL